MADIYLDRITRIVAPRDGSTGPAGACRAVACNVATTSIELDNDILQLANVSEAVPATTGVTPGSYGRALVQFMAEGNNLYLNFGQNASVVANSAATSGNTQAMLLVANTYVPPFEIDPKIDRFVSARTIAGGSLTATLRYRVVSFPTTFTPT